MNARYKCVKCGNSTYVEGQLRAASGFWTKIFNIQNLKFVTISCKKCGHTDLFKNMKEKRTAENILDFLTN